MALLKSRLPFQEQAAQFQVQAQHVAPTTSSLRAHAASVDVCINTATTSTQPFCSAKLPPSSQEELVLLRSLMQKEIADLTADRSEPQRLLSLLHPLKILTPPTSLAVHLAVQASATRCILPRRGLSRI